MVVSGIVNSPLNAPSTLLNTSKSSSDKQPLYSSLSDSSGYNPHNGNYFGDGSDLKYDEQGRALANIQTGAFYKDNSIASGRSDEGFKTQLDYQLQHVDSYISNAKKAGNQKAISFAEENRARLLSDGTIRPTWKFDGRGFGYSGNINDEGRQYWYDPSTGESKGNLKMEDPTYDLMRDSNYDYYKSYSDEVWDRYFDEWIDNGKLQDTTVDKKWLLSFKDY
ncbi:MAG TPA: hypothetical protein GX497_13690 [Bacillus bacterium]|nr:hypothetical protein [Bacillus sp. (in: firmicutes)]